MSILKKIKIKNAVLAIVVSIVAIFIPSFFMGKWVEGVFFFFCHWLIREQFPYQYHCPTHAICRLLTSIVFSFGVVFIAPISYSFLSAIPICYFISWVGYTKKKLNITKQKLDEMCELNVDNSTETQIRELCRYAGYGERKTEMSVDLFVRKISRKELAEKYSIEKDSVKMTKYRIRKDFEKYLDNFKK